MRRFGVLGSLLVVAIGCGGPPAAVAPASPGAKLSAPRYATTAPPSPAFVDPDRSKKIAALVPKLEKRIADYFAKEKPPSLAVVVVVDGKPLVTKLLAAPGTQSPTTKTLYRIGSITKTFTTEAVLALRDAGVWSLDEPAEKYLPELSHIEYPFADAQRFTLRQILTHTSGMPRLGDFDYTRNDRDVTEAEMMDALNRTSLANAPGHEAVYSNFAMSLLGPMIARNAPEKSYRATIAKRVTEPLGMASTTFDPSTTPGADVAKGKPDQLWRLGASEASGGLWSSIDDMTKYLAFQMSAWPARSDADSGPIKRATLREAHTPAFGMSLSGEVKAGQTKAFASYVGLSWQVEASCDFSRMVWHNGGIDGFRSVMAFLPEHGIGFVVLANWIELDVEDLQYDLLEDIASVKLEPRVAQTVPELPSAVNRWGSTFTTCDDASYDSLFTKSFKSAVPREKYAELCKAQGAELGTCTISETQKVKGPYDADYFMKCTKGPQIKVSASIVQEDGATRFNGLRFAKRTPPSAAVLEAARKALETNEKIKTNNGTCRLAPGAATALGDLPLECDKRKGVELHIELDENGKVREVEAHVNRRGGRCI